MVLQVKTNCHFLELLLVPSIAELTRQSAGGSKKHS